jgi:hypothetical protein
MEAVFSSAAGGIQIDEGSRFPNDVGKSKAPIGNPSRGWRLDSSKRLVATHIAAPGGTGSAPFSQPSE